MRYDTLACDYDGTLASNGTVEETTVAALRRFKSKGGRLLLVTGREMDDIFRLFPHSEIFEVIVAENGGVLYYPGQQQARGLAEPPPEGLIELLQNKGVQPLSIGRVILATVEPHEKAVLEAIHDLGLEYHIIFNKGAVMALPATVSKATGLKAALKELGLEPKQVAGVGDAENDHTFLQLCGYSAAVANALPALKEHAHLVTLAAAGAGVVELIDTLLAMDGAEMIRPDQQVPVRQGTENNVPLTPRFK